MQFHILYGKFTCQILLEKMILLILSHKYVNYVLMCLHILLIFVFSFFFSLEYFFIDSACFCHEISEKFE